MSTEKRKELRNKTYAKVLLKKNNTPGYLRDLSIDGCRISFLKPFPAKKGDAFILTIIPGDEIGIHHFTVFLEVCWLRSDSIFFTVGGRVSPLPGKENQERFKKLYDYYAV